MTGAGLPSSLAAAAFALAVVAGTPQAAEVPAPPDVPGLLARAQRVQNRDLAAWQRFAFRRQVVRRRVDADGSVSFRQDLDFRVVPAAGGGFDETLIAIDGSEPTPQLVRKHRRAARFSAHYQRAREGRLGSGPGELDFSFLFRGLGYRYLGREAVGGVACHHLAIHPVDASGGVEDLVAAATAGELWLTADGLHVARAKTRLTRPVSRALVEIERLEIELEGQPADGAWLPRRIEVRSKVNGLIRIRAHNTYTYSQLEARPPPR